jgi:hypothetical protein
MVHDCTLEGSTTIYTAEEMKCTVDAELQSFIYIILKHAVFAGNAQIFSPGHTHVYPTSSSLQINWY